MNKVLEWVINNEHPNSGIRAWQNSPTYPEVTGYIIPTLVKHGQEDLAVRCADYLVKLQGDDGSFKDWSGVSKTIFDTSACYEGLEFLDYDKEANKAKEWILSQPVSHEPYNKRAYALINEIVDVDLCENMRTHYYAYFIEGVLIGHGKREAKEILIDNNCGNDLLPFYMNSDTGHGCLPATAQFAMLYKKVGWDNSHAVKAVEKYMLPNGGLPDHEYSRRAISWAAKFYLDAIL